MFKTSLDNQSFEWCGDQELNGTEDCDGQEYCTDQCTYKPFASLQLDPHCVGVGIPAWPVSIPNPYPVPNVQVTVDRILKHDGAFPANSSISMGTTPNGPSPHIMVVTWPNQGYGTSSSSEVCQSDYVPPPVAEPVIPITGDEFIIPVTGINQPAALAAQQRVLLTMGASLLGVGLIFGGHKLKK